MTPSTATSDVAGGTLLPMSNLRDVVGYEGLYRVSDDGLVVSIERKVEAGNRFTKHPRTYKARVIAQHTTNSGYRRLMLWKDGKGRKFFVHRLVLTAFGGACPEGHESSHINSVRDDNRFDNLCWETRKENHNRKSYDAKRAHLS